MDRRSDTKAEVMVAELATHCAELSALLHESASALAELLPAAAAADGEGDGAAGPLAPDVLEIATLQAQAAGVGVEEWLREAVLAHASPVAHGPGGDGDGERPRRARADARRLLAESAALKAQTAQTARRARQPRAKDGDGPPPATR